MVKMERERDHCQRVREGGGGEEKGERKRKRNKQKRKYVCDRNEHMDEITRKKGDKEITKVKVERD